MYMHVRLPPPPSTVSFTVHPLLPDETHSLKNTHLHTSYTHSHTSHTHLTEEEEDDDDDTEYMSSSSSLSPIPRDVVERTVALYGQAWTTQRPDLLSQIFTTDVVYMERVFDRKATFVGLEAVTEYWNRQIGGKQSNITFRHLPSRMIRDADQPIAIVQWLAELDNRREHRGPDKTYKRVHFAQMARLTFVRVPKHDDDDDDNNNLHHHCYKVCELEEYAQPMTGPGVQWPGLNRPEHEYAAWFRMESPTNTNAVTTTTTTTATNPNHVVQCNYCQQGFPSRSQLFKHLSTTTPSLDNDHDDNHHHNHHDKQPQPCQAISQPTNKVKWVWISMSVGYTTHQQLPQRIKELVELSFPHNHNRNHNNNNKEEEDLVLDKNAATNDSDPWIDWNSCTWAVPPEWSTCAVANVMSIKMTQETWHRFSSSMNYQHQQQQHHHPPLSITVTPLVSPDQSLRIHTMVVVDRPCVAERREFEKYEVFVPWQFLSSILLPPSSSSSSGGPLNDAMGGVQLEQSVHHTKTSTSSGTTITSHPQGWRRQDYHQSVHRKPLEETPAGEFCHVDMTRRLRTGTRTLKDGGRTDVGDFFDAPGQLKIRLRCSTLDVPYQAYCRISMSMRQPRRGCVEAIAGLLVKFAILSEITEDDLRQEALNVTNQLKARSSLSSSSSSTSHNDKKGLISLPSDFCVLLEPGLNRYEVKAGVQLSGGYSEDTTPDSSFWAARQSMDAMEHSILKEMTSKLPQLYQWINENIRGKSSESNL